MPVSFLRVIVSKLVGTNESTKTVEPVRKVELTPVATTTLTREPIPVGTPKGMELLLKEAQAPTRTKGLNTRMNTAILALEDDQVDSLLQQIDLDAAEAKPLREAIEKNGTLGRKELAEMMNDDVLSGSLTSLSKDLIAHRCPFCKRFHFCKPGCCHCFCLCRCRCKGPKGDKGDPGTNGTNGANGVNGSSPIMVSGIKLLVNKTGWTDATNTIALTEPIIINRTALSSHADLDHISTTICAYGNGWIVDGASGQSIPIFLEPFLSKISASELSLVFKVRSLKQGVKPWDDLSWSLASMINEIHYTVIG